MANENKKQQDEINANDLSDRENSENYLKGSSGNENNGNLKIKCFSTFFHSKISYFSFFVQRF